jgi:hypothetical protein
MPPLSVSRIADCHDSQIRRIRIQSFDCLEAGYRKVLVYDDSLVSHRVIVRRALMSYARFIAQLIKEFIRDGRAARRLGPEPVEARRRLVR